MVQKVAVSREFEARLRHAATGKLSLSTQQKMGTFFKLGKDKAAKGEGWSPPFISCAQDTLGLEPPLPLRLLGYGKPSPLPLPSMLANRPVLVSTRTSAERFHGRSTGRRAIIH